MPVPVASRNAEVAASACLLAAGLYAALAGFTVPTQRALIMLVVAQLALLSRRSVDMSSGLSAAVLLVLAWDPAAPLSASFWLSFIAVALLWQLARSEYSRGGDRDAMRPVAGVARVQWYMSLGLVPVTALFFNQVSLISPFVNVIAIPLFSFVLVPLTLLASATVHLHPVGDYAVALAGALYRSGFDTGAEIVIPAMRAKSWDTLDAVVVSHADNDHAGGIPAVLEAYPDAQVLMGPDVELPGGAICRAGQAWTWDEVRFEVLHPDSAFHHRGNDSSCVLKVATSAGSLLLTGDVETAGERALMADAASLASDVVIVPHHGSATSSSAALVAATAPDHALVSAGYLNHWGFPKPQVAQRWQGAGAAMVSTGDAGAVRVIFEPGKPVQVRGQRIRQRRYWN